jgi:large subunit ribosomal protein L31
LRCKAPKLKSISPFFCRGEKIALVNAPMLAIVISLFMRETIHPKYIDAEIRCACGNSIKTRSTRPLVVIGICNMCHPFYTGTQKFIDTAGRVDKFQQRLAKTQAAQAAMAAPKKKKK